MSYYKLYSLKPVRKKDLVCIQVKKITTTKNPVDLIFAHLAYFLLIKTIYMWWKYCFHKWIILQCSEMLEQTLPMYSKIIFPIDFDKGISASSKQKFQTVIRILVQFCSSLNIPYQVKIIFIVSEVFHNKSFFKICNLWWTLGCNHFFHCCLKLN